MKPKKKALQQRKSGLTKKSAALRRFFVEIFDGWNRHKTEQMGAAFAFYTILSLPSLIILIFALSTFFFSNDQLLFNTVNSIFTPEIADDAGKIIQAAVKTTPKNAAAIFGFLALFWSASLLFENLIQSLRTIFEIPEQPRQRLKNFLFNRILAFLFIIVIEAILFLSIFLKNVLATAKNFIRTNINTITFLVDFINIIAGLLLPFLLFLFLFKLLAKIQISWRDAGIGAGITTLLFVLGNQLLSIYFSHFIDFSAFGAASTLIAMLIWVYYVSQILFLGAECTRSYEKMTNSKTQP